MNAFSVVDHVLVLFLLMGMGLLLSAVHFVNEEGERQISRILCYLVSPCLILNSFQMQFSSSAASAFLAAALAAAGIHLGSALLGAVLFRRKKLGERAAVMQFATTYSNCGFMGLPILQTIGGQMGVFLGTAYIGVFNLFCWTHGIGLYGGKVGPADLRRVFANPNIVAIAVSLVLFFGRITLPAPLREGIGYVAQINTALAMILVGTQLAGARVRELVGSLQVWAVVGLRNLFLPLALLAVLFAAGVRGTLLMCCVLPVACPAASYTVIFAQLSDRETRFPVEIVTLSTLLSVVTLPLIAMAVSGLAG